MELRERLEILLITYNRDSFLERTLQQILDNKSPIKYCDITILDNCSTDSTPIIISKYQEKYPNIKCIRHNRNIGGNANIARAFELASREYFWILCDDDFYNWDSWYEVERAIISKEELICVSTYALREEHSMEDLLLQLTFVPGVIHRTDNLTTTVMRNIYDNVWNSFPQLAPVINVLNAEKSVYVVNGEEIVQNGLFVADSRIADASYTRGDLKSDLFPTTRDFFWHSGFANSLVLLKDQDLMIRSITAARTNKALDVNITEEGVLRHIVNIAKMDIPSNNKVLFWNYYYRCDQATKHSLLELMFPNMQSVEQFDEDLGFSTNHINLQIVKRRKYPKWLISFACCFIPKKKNRDRLRAKHMQK